MKSSTLALLFFLTLAIVGCASSPKQDSEIAAARAELDSLKADPSMQNHAASALLDAEQSLQRAEGAHKKGEKSERDHQVYLARREMEIARATDERVRTEQEIKDLGEESDRLALESRESELAKQREELAKSREELAQTQARTRELESELASMEAKRTERGMIVTLDDLFFASGGASIAPGATPTLDKVVDFLKNNPDQHVVVEGHTDATGAASRNQQLSQERATAVKNEIAARGVDPARIIAKGYGASRPVASNATSGGRQLNRRVEIIFPDVGQ